MRGTCGRLALAALLLNGCLVWPGLAANAPGDAPASTLRTTPGNTPAPSWPHAMNVHGANVVVYQPQAISWPEHHSLTARAAVSITPPGAPAPILGTIELTLATHTDAATDNVYFSDPQLVSSHFPTLDTAQATHMEEQIRNALPEIQTQPVPLRSILLSLKDQAQPPNVSLEDNPPVIFSSDKPASLVIFDGDPVLAPVGQTGLSFAVNTNWDVFSDGKDWYLLNNGLWLSAKAYGGPYQPISSLPPAFSKLPTDRNFEDVRKAIPPKPGRPPVVPAILVSTKPAEIIVTNGPPQFVAVTGTSLQSVKNTTSTLFLQPSSGEFYLLASGRWFSAHGLDGPWQFATGHLPPDFALIPPESPQARVLASVPGTSQAQLAVLQAQVPRQATLKKDAAKLTVIYAGQPQFKPIPGTPMMYAVNTSFEVIETGGHYYVCYQGAWFAGPSPNGPWVLAESVPQVIYTIPPSSPLYNVTYVKVYGATPAAVTFGYTSGYMMGFVSAGVMVYGTGYYYPPVVISGPVPIYYPYPYSYTGNVTYNTTTGAWTHGGTVSGPYATATGGTYYNPSTGAWGRGGAVYGPNGGAGGFSSYNPSNGSYARGSASWSNGSGSANASYYNARTGVSGSTNQNWNPYSRWGSSTFTGANQTVNTRSGSNAQGSAGAFQSSTGAKGAGYSGVNGNKGGAVKTQGGDVYAGHDGNVYQHSSSGWSQWNNGAWQPVTPPTNQTKPQTTQTSAPSSGSSAPQNREQASSPSSQTAHQTAQNRPQSRQTSTQAAQHGSRQTMDTSSYQQLEQDRQARFAGSEHSGGSGGRFGGGGFSGGRFGGGEFGGGGGGHFRR